MRTGLIIVCRYNSSRLPGKILCEIEGKPLLAYIHERLLQTRDAEDIVVATSVEDHDDRIEDFCRSRGISCYRGHLEDVAGRFLACAQHFGFDFAGRINGDNLFVDIPTVRKAIAFAESDDFDFITNVPGRTFPYGMSVELVRTSFFETILADVDDGRLREHITLCLYENEELGRRKYIRCPIPEGSGIQMAIDEPADLRRARRMMKRMDRPHIEYDLADLLRLLAS